MRGHAGWNDTQNALIKLYEYLLMGRYDFMTIFAVRPNTISHILTSNFLGVSSREEHTCLLPEEVIAGRLSAPSYDPGAHETMSHSK